MGLLPSVSDIERNFSIPFYYPAIICAIAAHSPIQLADVTALPTGFVYMETRMLSVVMRFGALSETFKQIIRASHRNIREISECLGYSVYDCLPRVDENSRAYGLHSEVASKE